MKGGVTAAAACCDVCTKQAQCKGFTFFSGACFLKSCPQPPAGHSAIKRLPGAVSGYLKQ